MAEDSSTPGPPRTDSRAAELAAVERDHRGWYCFEGVIAGVLYARRIMSSPPRVVRSMSVAGLAEAIEDDQRQHGER